MPSAADPDALRRADLVLVRHGETTYNAGHLLNGDPSVDVSLSPTGRAQVEELARKLAPIAWSAVYVTRFRRTAQSAAILVPGREPIVCPLLDDIDVGEFEGRGRDDYRAWRREHGVDEAPRGGESRVSAARRYGEGLGRLAAEAPRPALVVTHDQPIRYLENVLAGGDAVLGPARPVPNAVPFAYSAGELTSAAERLRRYGASA